MTGSTVVVVLIEPATSSKRLFGDMVEKSIKTGFDVVAVLPEGETWEIVREARPAHSCVRSLHYPRRIPASVLVDSAIRFAQVGSDRGLFFAQRLNFAMRKRLRPWAQMLDSFLWPLTDQKGVDGLVQQLNVLVENYDRSYLIYTHEKSLTRAIELAQVVAFSAAGSSELFHLVCDISSEHPGEQQ